MFDKNKEKIKLNGTFCYKNILEIISDNYESENAAIFFKRTAGKTRV